MTDVQWLVEEVGPRPYESRAERTAAAGVAMRLSSAGWDVTTIAGSPVACRGRGETLFLAHVDSVPDSPGAIDNAGAVALLLELARSTEARHLCLGFPLGEEVGLLGSRWMAREWTQLSTELPQLVVALDLVGEGVPTAIDIDAAWGTAELRWLFEHAPGLDLPFVYRTVGRALPQGRSDHAPFADLGIPAFLLISRGPEGVFTRYHQPNDDRVDPESLLAAGEVLEGIATAGRLPRSAGKPAFTFAGHVVPGGIAWLGIVAGLASGAADLGRWRTTFGTLFRGTIAAFAAASAMALIPTSLFSSSEAETTARAVMGVEANGWWAAAPVALCVGLAVWLSIRIRWGGRGSAPLLAALMAGGLLAVDPLLALPLALAALAARVHPLFALAPVFVWLRPGPMRELVFHGLVPPICWGILWILAIPAFGIRRTRE